MERIVLEAAVLEAAEEADGAASSSSPAACIDVSFLASEGFAADGCTAAVSAACTACGGGGGGDDGGRAFGGGHVA